MRLVFCFRFAYEGKKVYNQLRLEIQKVKQIEGREKANEVNKLIQNSLKAMLSENVIWELPSVWNCRSKNDKASEGENPKEEEQMKVMKARWS